MVQVNIATLKARLSFYLDQVRKGQELLILDRRTPVAKVVSSSGRQDLVIEAAKRDPRVLRELKPRAAKRRTDSSAILRDERERR